MKHKNYGSLLIPMRRRRKRESKPVIKVRLSDIEDRFGLPGDWGWGTLKRVADRKKAVVIWWTVARDAWGLITENLNRYKLTRSKSAALGEVPRFHDPGSSMEKRSGGCSGSVVEDDDDDPEMAALIAELNES